MRNTLLCCFFLLCSNLLHAQKGISLQLGYGTENNWGNTHFFAGIGWEKKFKKRIQYGAQVTGLTTSIYNAYKGKEKRPQFEDRNYNALFVTFPVSFIIGNTNGKVKVNVYSGPSVKFYSYKMFRSGRSITTPSGEEVWLLETIKYEEGRRISLNLFVATDIVVSLNDKIKLSAFIDTYSGQILLEHFMPGLKVGYKF